MRTWRYPATITDVGDGEWLVTFADIPEALTAGATREAAIVQAADALEEAILGYLAGGRDVPSPRPPRADETPIDLDPVTAARVLLAETMKRDHLSNVALAKRMGRTEGAVRRLTSAEPGVKMDTVLEALRAVGQRVALASE